MRNSKMNISDKTFNESLMTLLKDGKVCMIGYDFGIYQDVKRIPVDKARWDNIQRSKN
jgi:hypothetical protein